MRTVPHDAHTTRDRTTPACSVRKSCGKVRSPQFERPGRSPSSAPDPRRGSAVNVTPASRGLRSRRATPESSVPVNDAIPTRVTEILKLLASPAGTGRGSGAADTAATEGPLQRTTAPRVTVSHHHGRGHRREARYGRCVTPPSPQHCRRGEVSRSTMYLTATPALSLTCWPITHGLPGYAAAHIGEASGSNSSGARFASFGDPPRPTVRLSPIVQIQRLTTAH